MVIVILGPTGVGKTRLSVALAHKLNGEIINADSMQIYKDLNIGTAKIKEEEKGNIPHHLFDIKEVEEPYSVYHYQKDARTIIDQLLANGKTPILVGGTGLYIKACLYNYTFEEEPSSNQYLEYSNEALYQKLLQIDPHTKIHMHNRRRIVRALNAYELTGTILSHKRNTTLLYETIFIGLTTDRDILYQIIDNRVDQMIQDGLLDEVKRLYLKNIKSKSVMTGIGYKELYQYFDGTISLEEAIHLIKRNSRRYAKRQNTFFTRQLPVTWFHVNYQDFDQTVEEVLYFIKNKK